jgi:hypothetical protein
MVPFRDASVYNRATLAPALEQLSREAAAQSQVLLKNQPRNNQPLVSPAVAHGDSVEGSVSAGAGASAVLPVDVNTLKKVAVVGLQDRMFSDYDTGGGDFKMASDVLSQAMGIGGQRSEGTDAADKEVRVAWGCQFLNHTAHPEWQGASDPACHHYNSSAVAAAIEGVDLAIVFIGTGKIEAENHDLKNLTLFGKQQQMLDDVLASAPRLGTVVVVATCTPMDISKIIADYRVSAVIWAGYAQHTSGYGVIETILGNSNPSGKLPFTWPFAATVALEGDYGLTNYTMIGTNKTYRYQGLPADAAGDFTRPLVRGLKVQYLIWVYASTNVPLLLSALDLGLCFY